MLDTIQKLTYRAKANILNAVVELEERLCDRRELPLAGIHGERLYLTGVSQLEQRAAQLQVLYGQLPVYRNPVDNILLDAWASASIEGAKVSLPEVKENLSNPKNRDQNMIVNVVRGSNYAYGRPITQKNLRLLWEKVTEGVCENVHLDGSPTAVAWFPSEMLPAPSTNPPHRSGSPSSWSSGSGIGSRIRA